MKIDVVRDEFTPDCTLGELYIDGEHMCFTLEDTVRPDGEKVFGKTAIPYGTYNISITYSPHFCRDLPLLADVPNFSGVRIHSGNTAADTEGCLLVGLARTGESVTQSRDAFAMVYAKIRDALSRGEDVTINYRRA